MRRAMIVMPLVLVLAAGACAADATGSDEYQALENELATVQAQLSNATAELEAATAGRDSTNAEPASSSARHDAALQAVTTEKNILDDPESFGTEEEVVDLLATSATTDAVMDDDVFGAFPYRQAWHNTLYGKAFEALSLIHI